MTNTLYYGDNLKILREYNRDESIDLVYLDPLSTPTVHITCCSRMRKAKSHSHRLKRLMTPSTGTMRLKRITANMMTACKIGCWSI